MRRPPRGTTLIEAMVAVAMLGILAVSGADGVDQLKRHSISALQRERALQVLEYEAAAIVSGRPVDPAATRALLELLPEGRLESKARGGRRTLTVTWAAQGKTRRRELIVLETSK